MKPDMTSEGGGEIDMGVPYMHSSCQEPFTACVLDFFDASLLLFKMFANRTTPALNLRFFLPCLVTDPNLNQTPGPPNKNQLTHLSPSLVAPLTESISI